MALPRGSGILLHPTSLPGPLGSGDVGEAAESFLGWLERAGQRYWQVLPLNPTGYGHSPYSALSAFATDPLLIDVAALERKGWLPAGTMASLPSSPPRKVDFGDTGPLRLRLLREASEAFFARATPGEKEAYEAYCARHVRWLEDYALFMALHDHHGGVEWTKWERALATRQPDALDGARRTFAEAMRFHRFTQWVFAEQWAHLRRVAARHRVQLIGDVPIFVAHNSADVWARPELFELDETGTPTVVAGVPPDYFSKTGQRWGNPLYRWNVLKRDDYAWWVERLRSVLETVDYARLDHFRGFAGHWEIPAAEETAVKGRWVPGPGAPLFEALQAGLGGLPIIAEDLGVITPDVAALRDRFGLPGMKVLQFAFGSGSENAFLPHNYARNAVVYTGTHDNDTTRGWYGAAPENERHFARQYIGSGGHEIHWDLMRLASRSVADVALFPFQDLLGLGTEGRMNRPGVAAGNWDWRFSWDEVPVDAASRLLELTTSYGRLGPR